VSKFRIATYNVENLFDRFDDPYSIGDDKYGKYRAKPKARAHLYDAGSRIRDNGVPRTRASSRPMPIDIVALQELENFGALLDFVQGSVGPDYGAKVGVVSQPSNDPRGIDLGCIVRDDLFRVGRVISHRYNKFEREDGRRYQFSRDCMQVEILLKSTQELYLTLFNCHFKSKYTRTDRFKNPDEYKAEQELNTIKRKAEASEVVRIVKNAVDVDNDRFVVCGDFNDTPGSEALRPLLATDNALGLTNAISVLPQSDLAESSTTRRSRDTHHWEKPVTPTEREHDWAQIDYIMCSKKLWQSNTGAADVINSPRDQGSDHYLSYIEFELSN